MAHTSDLRQSLERNEERLFVFPLEGLQEEWRQRKLRTAHKFAGYVAPAKDTLTAYKICRELGVFGRVAVTTAGNGRTIVIVKGYPGVRSVLTGTTQRQRLISCSSAMRRCSWFRPTRPSPKWNVNFCGR